MSKKYWAAALCLGLMTLSSAPCLWAADQTEIQKASALKAKMKADGWTEISDNVFERQRGATKVEHLGYGKEGLAWTVGELMRQLQVLKNDYQIAPSEDLAKIIDELSIKIDNARKELRNMPNTKGVASMTAAAATGCGSICYGATADAYPLTSTQGVAAVADAKFNNSCGYSGDTYAYAFARATLNGTTTTVTQSDPHTGTSVTSHAAASVNGGSITGTPCSSNANSYAQSTALGISYTTSATNSSCPAPTVPALVINSISPTYVYSTTNCKSVTWSASVSGGTTPYTYAWNVGGTAYTTATVTKTLCGYQDVAVSLTVTDSTSPTHKTASSSTTTTYDPDTGTTCFAACP